jgi:hypothetical protein
MLMNQRAAGVAALAVRQEREIRLGAGVFAPSSRSAPKVDERQEILATSRKPSVHLSERGGIAVETP